jgi:nicotinamide-nucleotide amidase
MTTPDKSRAELIVVGDELLSGRVVDENSAFLGRHLADLGLRPQRIVKVGDDEAAIVRTLREAASRASLVIVAGGMGPTPDDKTVHAVAAFAGRRLVVHHPTLEKVRATFRGRRMKIPETAERQALVPEGARLLDNPLGMAPGMIVRHADTTFVLLPGVPVEMESIFMSGVLRYIKAKFGVKRPRTTTIRTFGTPESVIAERARVILGRHRDVRVAFYPSTEGVDIVLRAAQQIRLTRCRDEIARLLGKAVYGVGTASMEEVVGRLLRRKRMTIATAESCTGGLVGDRLTNVPGSSSYYRGGVVSYSNEAKMKLLGVRQETLGRFGAVSRQTVRQMAAGVQHLLKSDAGVAVSGIAGPGGGTRQKPAGLVYVAARVHDRTAVEEHFFTGSRRMVKERSAAAALDLCRRTLEERR